MYKELTIENIKTFEKEQKLKIAPMTLIYGENSSGKTTLLKTFDIVHNIFAEEIVKRGKNIAERGGVFYRRRDTENISAKKIHFFSSKINKKIQKIEIKLDLNVDKEYKDLKLLFPNLREKKIIKNILPYVKKLSGEWRSAKVKNISAQVLSAPIIISLTIKYSPKRKISKIKLIELKRDDGKKIISFSRIDKVYKEIYDSNAIGFISKEFKEHLRNVYGTKHHRLAPFMRRRYREDTKPDYFVDGSLYSDYKINISDEDFIWRRNYEAYKKIFTDDKYVRGRLNVIQELVKASIRFNTLGYGDMSGRETMFNEFIYYITKYSLNNEPEQVQDWTKYRKKINYFFEKIKEPEWYEKFKDFYKKDKLKIKAIDIKNKLSKEELIWMKKSLFAKKFTHLEKTNLLLLQKFLYHEFPLHHFINYFKEDLDKYFKIRFLKKTSNTTPSLVKGENPFWKKRKFKDFHEGWSAYSTSDIFFDICNYINGDLSNVFYNKKYLWGGFVPSFKETFTHSLLKKCIREIRETVNDLVICHPNRTEVPYDVPNEEDYPPEFWEDLSKIKEKGKYRKELAKQDEEVRKQFLNPNSVKSFTDRRKVYYPDQILSDGGNFDRVIINNSKIRKKLNKILKETLNLEVLVTTPKFLKKIIKNPSEYRAFREAQRKHMTYATGQGRYSQNKFIMLRDLYFKKFFPIHGREVGKGPANILPFLTQILSEKPNLTYLVQELENNWHPKAQVKIIELIAKNMKDSVNKHFVLETHSELFILQVKKLVQKGILKPEDVSINYISRSKKGESQVHHIPVNSQGGFEKPWPGGFFTERMEVVTS